jgi:DNA-binding transcriptional MerR regulator
LLVDRSFVPDVHPLKSLTASQDTGSILGAKAFVKPVFLRMSTYPDYFTTEQVATLLGLKPKEKWRVIKFVEGKEYGIKPAFTPSSGPGSRRLYNLENVCEIALALEFLEAGLRPAVIGEALERLRKNAKLSQKLIAEQREGRRMAVLIAFEPKIGKLLKQSRIRAVEFADNAQAVFAVQDEMKHSPGPRFFLISVTSTFRAIKERLEGLFTKGQ